MLFYLAPARFFIEAHRENRYATIEELALTYTGWTNFDSKKNFHSFGNLNSNLCSLPRGALNTALSVMQL